MNNSMEHQKELRDLQFERDFVVSGSALSVWCAKRDVVVITDDPEEGLRGITTGDIRSDYLYRVIIQERNVYRVSEIEVVDSVQKINVWI